MQIESILNNLETRLQDIADAELAVKADAIRQILLSIKQDDLQATLTSIKTKLTEDGDLAVIAKIQEYFA